MSITYDWSPVFNAINGIAQKAQYQKQLSAMFGSPETTPGAPAMQANMQLPGMQMPGVQAQPNAPVQFSGAPNASHAYDQMPGGGGGLLIPGGAPKTLAPQMAQASTPALPSQTSYNGPAAQMFGDQTPALMAMLQGMNPEQGQQMLPPLLLKTMEKKQEDADRTLHTLTPQEAAAKGYRSGAVVQEDPFGHDTTAQQSDLESPEAIQQKEGLYTDENAYQPIPANDPAYKNYRPGTVLGRNKLGAVKEMQASDMKSQGAMGQEMQLVTAKENADIAKQNAMYGLGGNGAQPDFSKPLASNAYEQVAQSVANYDRSEATALSRYPAPIRAQIQARVSAINPNYTQTDYNAANATKLAFAKGPQGQSIQSLNSTISHMDLMKQYVAALNNGDVQTVNSLKNAVATEFGGTAPTNAQAVAEILGPEMAKAVLPNGGTGPEREGFINTLKQKASQGQLLGTLDTYQGLMSGQLLSLKKRYENIPGHPADFENKFLLPETQHILASRPEYKGGVTSGNGAPPAGGSNANIAPAGTKAIGPGGKTLTSDGKGGWH